MYMWGSVYVTACICGFARAFRGLHTYVLMVVDTLPGVWVSAIVYLW